MLVKHRLCCPVTKTTKTTASEGKATTTTEEFIKGKTKVWLASLRPFLGCCVAKVVIVTSFVWITKCLEKNHL